MKRPEGQSVKTYCYKPKGECKIVKAGFHLLEFHVCSTCKQEVSENLKNQKEDDQVKGDVDSHEWWMGYGGDNS